MEIVSETIGQSFKKIAEKYRTAEILLHLETGVRYTYDLLAWDVDRIGRGLLALGIGKGDNVALWAPNVPEWIVAQLAIASIGAVAVPVNPGADQEDLHHILDQTEAKAIIMAKGLDEGEFIEMILAEQSRVSNLEHIIVFGEAPFPGTMSWAELGARGEEISTEQLEKMTAGISPEDPVAIMYTSGTTGKPKGVVLDHLGLINKSLCAMERQGLEPNDRICLFFPLYHMFGNTCIALTGLLAGSSIVIPSKDFEPASILSAIAKEQCTAIYGSPSMFSALLEHPEFNEKAWASVKKGIVGGAPCPAPLMERLVNELGISGLEVGYGITEASSWVTMTKQDDPIDLRVSTIGYPLPCSEVKIVDPETGERCKSGEKGELCTKGFLMKGYYRMPGATKAAIDDEGWFHTGDLGIMDENGYVKLVGRLKEVIRKAGGIEILPAEIEEVLYLLSDVSQAQVFGFNDKTGKTLIAAFVKVKEGSSLQVETIRKMLASELSGEKIPDYIKIVEDFPVTKSGKIQKFRLAQMAVEQWG